MPESLRLAISSLRGKPIRALLSCLAVMMAVALVFCSNGAMDCLEASFTHNLDQRLGRTTARVLPAFAAAHQLLPFSVIPKLLAMRQIKAVQGRATAHMPIQCGNHLTYADVVGIQMAAADSRVNPLPVAEGRPLSSIPNGIVLNGALAAMLGAHVGSTVTLTGKRKGVFILTGIMHRSAVRRFISFPQAYIRLQNLRHIWPIHGLTRVDVRGMHGIKPAEIAALIRHKLGPIARVQAAGTARKAFSRMKRVIRDLRLGVSIPAAIGAGMLVLGLGLVGLAGRIRELGRLRCIGASPVQIFTLVIFEQIIIAAGAIIGGCAVGLAAVRVLTFHYSHFFTVFHISFQTFLFAAADVL